MCGADAQYGHDNRHDQGSPPRVRSRLFHRPTPSHKHGITSACAEQTTRWLVIRPSRRDHLRVCGADVPWMMHTKAMRGSPPRVRSRPHIETFRDSEAGITSACAEQTRPHPASGTSTGDHLRVCGADTGIMLYTIPLLGSPPRVRSRRGVQSFPGISDGITSACAEQTMCWPRLG